MFYASEHPACMDHAILHGKPFSNPLVNTYRVLGGFQPSLYNQMQINSKVVKARETKTKIVMVFLVLGCPKEVYPFSIALWQCI